MPSCITWARRPVGQRSARERVYRGLNRGLHCLFTSHILVHPVQLVHSAPTDKNALYGFCCVHPPTHCSSVTLLSDSTDEDNLSLDALALDVLLLSFTEERAASSPYMLSACLGILNARNTQSLNAARNCFTNTKYMSGFAHEFNGGNMLLMIVVVMS